MHYAVYLGQAEVCIFCCTVVDNPKFQISDKGVRLVWNKIWLISSNEISSCSDEPVNSSASNTNNGEKTLAQNIAVL